MFIEFGVIIYKKVYKKKVLYIIIALAILWGGLAQLARAPALHAGGHRFDSDILHS